MSISVSFEFFPPRTAEGEGQFWSTIARLERHNPDFVSVTYGAGGSSRDATIDTVARVVRKTSLTPAGHLTTVGQSREDTDAIIRTYWESGVRGIVALRGDMPGPGDAFNPHPEGYEDTPALVKGIKAIADFDVSVAAYPEKHPDSPSTKHDLELLARKVDAGASRGITQFCFIPELIVKLRDAADAAGIKAPIVPGILPVNNLAGTIRIAERCGATVPQWLIDRYRGLEDDPATARMLAGVVAAEQVDFLRKEGFTQFHLYTLNRPEVSVTICQLLGVHAKTEEVPA